MPGTTREGRRAELVNHYLIGIGLAGIFVVGKADGPSLMIATDIAGAVRALEAQDGAVVLRRMWFSNAAVATVVYQIALKAVPLLPPSSDPAHDLAENVYQVATTAGVDLKDDQMVAAQCAAAVDEIEAAIEAARASGGLKDVNQAYKQHRIEMGKSAFPYEVWLHHYKLKAVEAAAHRVRSVLRSSTA